MALRCLLAGSSKVCSKFRLSPAMVRTSRLAAPTFPSTYTNQMEKPLLAESLIATYLKKVFPVINT
ncbi:hypothetical protein OUZ56_017599 [Daphnia magna]|uniref:Uncharacterized protein n=1 Tax=Daphnia magna TaxID=35525 RepID=A0ABR0AT84_9CRUS|nr:hypothetical protein OUZ56_017599 [Daphnia magna]